MKKTITYILVLLIVIILGALAGWYFFLRGKTDATTATDTARGLGHPAPSFNGISSTQNNATASFSPAPSTGALNTNNSTSPLWHVDKTPVAGMRFIKTATSSSLYYVERGNGYVFSADPNAHTITRLTDTLMPKTYEAIFASDGSVIERSIQDDGSIATFVGVIIATTTASDSSNTAGTLKGTYLPHNIIQIAAAPKGRSVVYLLKDASPGVSGAFAQWDGSKAKTFFNSPITHWQLQWLADGRMVILEAPADDMSGYAYILGSDGALSPLVRNIPGLTVLPSDSSSALLYGSSSHGALTLFVRQSPAITPVALSIQTIADKCVWAPTTKMVRGKTIKQMILYCAVPTVAPNGTFINDWYRGVVHTTDTWWKVDASSGTASQIYAPNGLSLDVLDPTIDPSETHISFINAVDDSLWVLTIPQ